MSRNQVKKTLIVGSPEATILRGRNGFFGEEKYNLEVLAIGQTYPDYFIVFPTINPRDSHKLEKLEAYLKMGGRGLKLYGGHSFFHDLPLDHPDMNSIYELCQTKHIPILYHVNPALYKVEFENVLKKYDELKIICPHLCLSTINTDRLKYFLDNYPNLFTDISMGYIDFLKAALIRFSKNPKKYRELIIKYSDRIFFGTDMVITNAEYKTVEWLEKTTRVYRDLLEKKEYKFFDIPNVTLHGLDLPEEIIEKIYHSNFETFMAQKY